MDAADLLRRLDRRVLPPLARGLRRLARGAGRIRLLTAVAAGCVAAVTITAVWVSDHRPRAAQPSLGEVVRVGVLDGQSIPAYVQSSRAELAALLASAAPGPTTETYALVTLTAYLAPDRLTPVLGGTPVVQVYARVPLPDTQTEIVRIAAHQVPADVLAGMADVATRKTVEATDYQRRAAGITGDGPTERDLRTTYTSGAQVAAAEAIAYREHCSCVYAAVVRATPAILERIAGRPEVRAVDPAPEVRRLDRAVFLPPLPEQTDLARPPSDRQLGATAAPSTVQPPSQ